MSAMSHDAMLIAIKNLARYHGGQKALAEKLGVSCQYLSDVIRGRRNIGPSISEALGYRQVVSLTFEHDSELCASSPLNAAPQSDVTLGGKAE